MSGDVQPRKRKDKKRKKDELGIEEPRGTAAVFGEGDVFIHSYHEHGTGGHWCAKIIFFSLLAVLATLIGLIILENRGLSDLEANAVESRYSGVLEGWIEDAPDNDHHDEHTLELKHPDDEELQEDDDDEQHEEDDEDLHEDDDEDIEHTEDSDDENDNQDGHNENDEEEVDNEEVDDEDAYSKEQNSDIIEDIQEEDSADIAYSAYKQYDDQNRAVNYESEEDEYRKEESDDEGDEDNDNDEYEQNENSDQVEENYNGDIADDDDEKWEKEEEHEVDDDDDEEEVEKLEQEISDEDIRSSELEAEERETGDDNDGSEEDEIEEDNTQSAQLEDDEEPPVERITIPPPGKPYTEIEEETVQKTPDTLADEEEYERQQEQLKREREAQSSQGMWLKLLVGGALLAATHAVVRRATAPRDEPEEEQCVEEPSVSDRRMTLIPQTHKTPEIIEQVTPQEEIVKKTPPIVQTIPSPKLKPEEDKTVHVAEEEIEEKYTKEEVDKELYSDEEEEEEEIDEEEEEEEVEEIVVTKPPVKESKTEPTNKSAKPEEEPPEEDEDVEIIDEEEIEEELEDEEEEEEISDVDDSDLLSRLDAKYGRLPEPERPGKNKDGGNSIEDDWPGEPNDPYWSQQLDLAEEELRQGAWSSCEQRASAKELKGSARAQFVVAKALDLMAEAKRDNRLLSRAIAAYLQLLKMNERLSDKKLVDIAQRAIDRIQFRGTYLNAEPIYRLLIRRFPNNVHYRNNLTVSFLMANRADLADTVLKETIKIWPNDRIALAHYGFVLKNQYNKLEESVLYLQKALEGDAGAANEPRFFYHLGDALLQLGRLKEAQEIHEKGAKLGHFLSPEQRSLYNVARLKSRPWWPIETTPYVKLVRDLEYSWKDILKEGLAARDLYEKEKEGLKEKGEWSQLDIFVRGQEIPGRCKRAPVTCSIVRQEPGARCRRGQIKFSSMEAGTHVRPHVGPTNCRLRMHLALSNTKDTYIRVGKVTRQWELGKVFIFDDSFEHEVWHNGTGSRLVLIVDVWHPDLTATERKTLPAI